MFDIRNDTKCVRSCDARWDAVSSALTGRTLGFARSDEGTDQAPAGSFIPTVGREIPLSSVAATVAAAAGRIAPPGAFGELFGIVDAGDLEFDVTEPGI